MIKPKIGDIYCNKFNDEIIEINEIDDDGLIWYIITGIILHSRYFNLTSDYLDAVYVRLGSL